MKFEFHESILASTLGLTNDIRQDENHIQTAYVTVPVGTNSSQTSNPTTLTKGEYVYFCPLNPTATDNILVVE